MLPGGSEVTAWAQDRLVAIARVPEKDCHLTLDENSTAAWMLAQCRADLSEDLRREFASLVHQHLQAGFDVNQLMVHPDLFAWLAKRLQQPNRGLMVASSSMKRVPTNLAPLNPAPLNEEWCVLPATASVFQE
jgi:hypothetical protein